jgi:death-on-curing protein
MPGANPRVPKCTTQFPAPTGNKRLGWLATAVFLDINHIEVAHAANDDLYQLVIHVAADDPSIEEIAEQLQRLCQTRQP